MLTDEDKVDLICYISESMLLTKSDFSRIKLVARSHRGILDFIIDHPDVCAAEIDDFFSLGYTELIQEYDRLEKKGML